MITDHIGRFESSGRVKSNNVSVVNLGHFRDNS
jgi:hypothetical protein